MELRQYFNILLKWWWLIVAAVVVAGGASLLSSLSTPRVYQSQTTVMVGQALQNPNPNQSDIYLGEALAQSYTDLVRREPVLQATLDALGLQWDWQTLQSMLSSRVVPGTQLLEISVLDTDPKRAKTLAEEVVHQLILQSPAATDPEKETERQFILAQIQDLKTNIEKSKTEIRQLDDVIANATSARQIQDARSRQSSLQTQVSTWQATYAQLLSNLQLSAPNSLTVVEPARIPTSPVGSGTAANVLLAAAIGLALASGAAFVIEYLDDTLKTSDDVRKVMGLATLGGITQIDGDGYANMLIAARQPRSATAEAYRMLRTNIQFSVVDNQLCTLMVTSPSPEEGKSVTAANIAVVMAQAGQRVALVDADLRRPAQHRIFELNNNIGLTTILLDSEAHLSDMLQATALDNLKVMTAGPLPPNPSELLGSKRMGYLIEALKKKADIVVFDSAPVMAVADASVLARRLDGTVIVVDVGHTRRGPAQRSIEALAAVSASVLGAVLNRVPTRNRSYSYYYSSDDDQPSRARVTRAALQHLLSRRNGQSAHAATPSRLPSPPPATAAQEPSKSDAS